jgi:acyl-CoA thioester hydrolase
VARVDIPLPEQFVFSTEIPLYIGHINYGGHLDNALLLTIVSEARIRFFGTLGHTASNVERTGFIVADAAVQYKSEAFYGDVLVVSMAPADFHAKGFDLVYCMRDKKSGREVARGKTGLLFIDREMKKVVAIPAVLREKLSAPSAGSRVAKQCPSAPGWSGMVPAEC